MKIAIAILSVIAAAPGLAQEPVVQQNGRILPSVPQIGVPQQGVPQQGVPQQGVPQVGNPPPFRGQGRQPPVNVIIGDPGSDIIPFPGQANLPDPAPGLVWRRIGNDAVLFDFGQGTVLEVRSHWFG